MKVEKIDHIHLIVRDLEGAMKFFSDILGSKFIGPIDRRPNRQCRYAFDTLGLELISPTSPDNWWSPVLEKEGEGLLSVGLKVPNLEEAVAKFQEKGLRLFGGVGTLPDIKVAIFRPEEAYGVRIELVEYDGMKGAGICNVGKMSELPWFKG